MSDGARWPLPGSAAPQPGALVFARFDGGDDWAIALGQHVRLLREILWWFLTRRGPRPPDRRRFAYWTHMAVVTDTAGGLIEASIEGIHRAQLAGEYTPENGCRAYTVWDPAGASAEDRAQAVAFCESCLGERYALLVFAWLGVTCLLGWGLELGLEGQEVCSGLAARATERLGRSLPKDGRFMTPLDMALWANVAGPP